MRFICELFTRCAPNNFMKFYRSQFQMLRMYVPVLMIHPAGRSLTLPQYMMIIMKNQ